MDRLLRSLYAEMRIYRSLVGRILHQVIDIIIGDGIEEGLVGTAILRFHDLLQGCISDTSLGGLSHR